MVEKVITPARNVVDFAHYREGRNAAPRTPVVSAQACRHCGAALLEGESEDDCSSTFNVGTPPKPRKFYAE